MLTQILHFHLCLLAVIGFATTSFAKASKLLSQVETHYRGAKTVQMDADKVITMKLLEKQKKSSGTIQIKKGGKLRWETETPEHSLVVTSGSAIWLVSYPMEEDEKPSIIKASNPKKSQPHAVVAFLMGNGHIGSEFSVISEKHDEDSGFERLELKPHEDIGEIHWLTLLVNKDSKIIESLSFEDGAGNTTNLAFKNIQFDKDIDNKVFKFTPPKGADVTVLN